MFLSFTEYSDFRAFLPGLNRILVSKYIVVKVLVSTLSFHSLFISQRYIPPVQGLRETLTLPHRPHDPSLLDQSFNVHRSLRIFFFLSTSNSCQWFVYFYEIYPIQLIDLSSRLQLGLQNLCPLIVWETYFITSLGSAFMVCVLQVAPPWSIFAFTCGHCIKQAHQRLNRVSCLSRRLKLLYSLNLFARQMDFQRCLYQYQLFACMRLTSPKFKQPSRSLFHEFCCNNLGL